MKITIDGTAAEVVELVTALGEGLVELVDEYRDDCMDDEWEPFDEDDDADEEEDHNGKCKVMGLSAKDGSDKNTALAVSQIMNAISSVMNDPESDKLTGKE